MKKLYFLILVFLSISVSAQIPGIQQQPKWVMPFFFEDANGEKDTIWLGYDPIAQCGPARFDSLFEKWYLLDTSNFQVILYQGQPVPSGFGRKIEITSCLDVTLFDINFINGKMPITMKWMDNLWYSDSLPYPQVSYYPRAKALLECSDGAPPYSNCLIGPKWTLTDSQYVNLFGPIKTDSFYFNGSGLVPPTQAILSLNIQIVDILHSPIGINDQSESKVKIYPNPAVNDLFIESSIKIELVKIYDYTGRIVDIVQSNSAKINVNIQNLSTGMYFIRINNAPNLLYKVMVCK